MRKKFAHTTDDGVSFKQAVNKTSEDRHQQEKHSPADKPKLCFVCSGLTQVQIMTVKVLAQKCNANFVYQFDPNVTHVIVNTTGKENAANSTLKYLQGVVHRKWIVSYKWIENCIKERKLLSEIPYEAITHGINGAGPRNSKLPDKNLFENFTFLCIEPCSEEISLDQYEVSILAFIIKSVKCRELFISSFVSRHLSFSGTNYFFS